MIVQLQAFLYQRDVRLPTVTAHGTDPTYTLYNLSLLQKNNRDFLVMHFYTIQISFRPVAQDAQG